MIDEYLTIVEVAARLKLKPKTIKNKMAVGIFKKGVHYFSPAGLSPRFKWSAVVAWIEQAETVPERDRKSIPMASGYWGKPTDRVELGNLKRETFKHEDKSKKAPFPWAEYHKAFNEVAKGQATISKPKDNQGSILPREGD